MIKIRSSGVISMCPDKEAVFAVVHSVLKVKQWIVLTLTVLSSVNTNAVMWDTNET